MNVPYPLFTLQRLFGRLSGRQDWRLDGRHGRLDRRHGRLDRRHVSRLFESLEVFAEFFEFTLQRLVARLFQRLH